MSGLKDVFGRMLGRGSQTGGKDEDTEGFEWNPDAEVVAPTTARAASWRRPDEESKLRPADVSAPQNVRATASNSEADRTLDLRAISEVPRPTFATEGPEPVSRHSGLVSPSPLRNDATVPDIKAATPSPAFTPEPENTLTATTSEISRPTASAIAPRAAVATPALALSDFEDVYRRAGIKSPVHGYGVERVYRLLNSRRLHGMDRTVRRSALLTALDAATVPASDVTQDAVLRRKALAAHEAEKALEMQSLRSRNEQRIEALEESIDVMRRQKQASLERVAQATATAVRVQSDLEIRKRMEQERLYRVLAYFVEPLPPPIPVVPQGALPRGGPVAEPSSVAHETIPVVQPIFAETVSTPLTGAAIDGDVRGDVNDGGVATAVTAATERPVPETEAPAPGLAEAFRLAAQEAQNKGWGRPQIIEDSGDAVESLRALRGDTAEPASADEDTTEGGRRPS